MSTKPAKLLTKLLDQTKADAQTIATLRAQLTQAQAAQAAAEAKLAPLTAQLDQALCEGRLAQASVANLHLCVDELLTQSNTAQAAIAARDAMIVARAAIASLTATRDACQRQLDQLQPEIALIAEQRAALTTILDEVRARLRRKEVAEERAILNRQALTAALPAINHR